MQAARRRVLVIGGVAVAGALAGVVAGPLLLQSRSGAPELLSTVFPDLSGHPRKLADWQGRPVVCNFWATWCAPCREEIPLLVDLHGAYAGKGVEVVGIALDQLAKIQEFAANFKISYPLLVGDVRAIEILHALGNRAAALPYTVVLSRAGGIAWRKLGQVEPGELEPVLDDILG